MASSDTTAIAIRPAARADVAAIGRLGALLVRLHHDLDSKRFIAATPGTEQGYAAFLGAQLGRPDVVVLVAERQGEVVGYAWAGVEGYDYMSLRGPAAERNDVAQRLFASVGFRRTMIEMTRELDDSED